MAWELAIWGRFGSRHLGHAGPMMGSWWLGLQTDRQPVTRLHWLVLVPSGCPIAQVIINLFQGRALWSAEDNVGRKEPPDCDRRTMQGTIGRN